MNWTTAEVPDCSGRVAVVTGATSGIGLEIARALAGAGATTVLAARDPAKAERVLSELRSPGDAHELVTLPLDLADLGSVRAFADAVGERFDVVDLLVNNAGIMLVPEGRTTDGFETHLGTNHLGHFALTGLLLPQLEDGANGRIVTVSSLAHREAELDFENLQYEHGGYGPMPAYRRSKLANLLFANELERRLRRADSSVISLAAHPGLADTNLGSHLAERWWWRVARPAVGAFLQSAAAGALPVLRAAVDEAAEGGQYYGPGRRSETAGPPVLVETTRLAQDRAAARRLWELSEGLTGIRYL